MQDCWILSMMRSILDHLHEFPRSVNLFQGLVQALDGQIDPRRVCQIAAWIIGTPFPIMALSVTKTPVILETVVSGAARFPLALPALLLPLRKKTFTFFGMR